MHHRFIVRFKLDDTCKKPDMVKYSTNVLILPFSVISSRPSSASIFLNERIKTSLSVNGLILPNKFSLMGHY